jgi:hypothetical protein
MVNNNNKVTMNHCTHLSFKVMSKLNNHIHISMVEIDEERMSDGLEMCYNLLNNYNEEMT